MISHDDDAVERHSLRAPEETEAAQRGKKPLDWRTHFSKIRRTGDHHNYQGRGITSKRTILFAFIIILPFLIIIIALAVWRGGKSNQTCPDVNNCAVLGPACPDGWVGYEGKCYFFSEEERNWTSAQSFCISQGSSLAKIQSELEMVFMLRFKGEAEHWIGLRKDFNDTWIWADGSEYCNTLVVKGSENCAKSHMPREIMIVIRVLNRTTFPCKEP
ncbi:C-type lectin domain-containing protein [Podarcis lilfordi]|uniref:C-type lectin domain-containing protein n=1 Tax=Podarcis lilfordi TaxID=74358 RepID=A0AA35JZD6_9SAUR|nr:C-type lectin domain-containing protein [Podarcis lilfordi]